MPKEKPRIYWTDSTGKKRDIPERAIVTLCVGDREFLHVWIEDGRVHTECGLIEPSHYCGEDVTADRCSRS